MNVRVKFLGGAGTVTGSKYLLEFDNEEVMIDCGLFQGLKSNRLKNWDDLPIDVSTIHSVILTHAHLDHTGYLPRLVKQGFSGTIYCTEATASLAEIILRDAAKLQEEEANYARKKGYSKHKDPQPLFTMKDVEHVLALLQTRDFSKEFSVTEKVSATYFTAGHILGAAIVKLKVKGERETKHITFSGDLGRWDDPILHDPTYIRETDILFVESTYGDRVNPAGDIEEQLRKIVKEALSHGGSVLIPAFAVGRTQLMIYYFHNLIKYGALPDNLKIFIDSPMAISVTDLYRKYAAQHKLNEGELTDTSNPVFDFKNIYYKRSHEESYAINQVKYEAVIISASGMMTGGRILHHLYNRLQNENDILVMVGYQAEGTRGRRIQDGEETIRIFGQDVPVKCKIARIEGLSAHADQTELMKWVKGFVSKPKLTFCIHGEGKSSATLAQKISDELGWNTVVPNYMESFHLFQGI